MATIKQLTEQVKKLNQQLAIAKADNDVLKKQLNESSQLNETLKGSDSKISKSDVAKIAGVDEAQIFNWAEYEQHIVVVTVDGTKIKVDK